MVIPIDLMRVLLIVSKKCFQIAKLPRTCQYEKPNLAPYLKSLLEADIKKSDCYVIFDESLNKKTQMCEMDVYIRYWDIYNKQVKVCHWGSEFLSHTTSKDLATSFTKSIESLNQSRILQITMDGQM